MTNEMDSDGDKDIMGFHTQIQEDVPAELNEYVNLNQGGNYELADQCYHECLEKHLDWFPVAAEYGDCLLRQGRYETLKSLCEDRLPYVTDTEDRNVMILLEILSKLNITAKTGHINYLQFNALVDHDNIAARIWNSLEEHEEEAELEATTVHCIELLLQIASKILAMIDIFKGGGLEWNVSRASNDIFEKLLSRDESLSMFSTPRRAWEFGRGQFPRLLEDQSYWEAHRVLQSLNEIGSKSAWGDLPDGSQYEWTRFFENLLEKVAECDDEEIAIPIEPARASFISNLRDCYPTVKLPNTRLQHYITHIVGARYIEVFKALFDPWPTEADDLAWHQSDLINCFVKLCHEADMSTSPLMCAVESGSETMLLAILSLLRRCSVKTLERSIDALGPGGKTRLMAAASSAKSENPELLQILSDRGMGVPQGEGDGQDDPSLEEYRVSSRRTVDPDAILKMLNQDHK